MCAEAAEKMVFPMPAAEHTFGGPKPPAAERGRRATLATRTRLGASNVLEVNEAFAAQAVYVQRELAIPDEKLNVNGGAIALGHPLGCTGAKLVATIIRELERRKARRGIVTMCIGGGMGAAGLIEMP